MPVFTIEKHIADIDDSRNLQTPHRCCSECRGNHPPIGLPPVGNQYYYCEMCRSVWVIPIKRPGIWVTNWRTSKTLMIADVIWVFLLTASFVLMIAGVGLSAIALGWGEDLRIVLLAAAGIMVWLAVMTVIGQLYRFLQHLIESAWLYLWSPAPFTERGA